MERESGKSVLAAWLDDDNDKSNYKYLIGILETI